MKSINLKLFVITILLSFFFLPAAFSMEIIFERTTPLYLRNYTTGCIETISTDLAAIWGFGLKLPIKIIFEKDYGLSAKGEAVMYPDHHEIILSPTANKIPELLRHETMHLFTFEWMFFNHFENLPLWFIEGIAVWYENRETTSISNLDPLNTWKETDFLNIEEYPTGDAFTRYYDFLADFFYSLQRKRDLRAGLYDLMNSITEKNDLMEALDGFYGSAFTGLHGGWRLERTFISLWGFILVNVGFIFPALVVIFLGVYTYLKNKNIRDSFTDDLEKKFGKNYWKEE